MSDATADNLRLYPVAKTDDPVLRARRAKLAEWAIEAYPELREKLIAEGFTEAFTEGRLVEARYAVRCVRALRQLTLTTADEARIDACTDLDTLRRWLGQAILAEGVVEALE